MTIDFRTNGFFDLPGGILFNAGAGGNDRLTIDGDPATTIARYESTDGTLGNATVLVTAAAESMSVAFTGVEPLDIHGMNHIRIDGMVNVGGQTLSLQSAGLIDLGPLTQLSGGTIQATGLLSLGIGESLIGSGTVAGRFAGSVASNVVATGDLAIGDATAPDGFYTDGLLQTSNHTVTLGDANQAVLGTLTTLGASTTPGTLRSDRGFLVGPGRNVTGVGTLDSPNELTLQSVVNGTVTGNSPSELISLSGYIKGNGSFDNVSFGGTHSPGSSPAQLIGGSVVYAGGSDLILELGGTVPGSGGHDQLRHSGTVSLGGDLDVSLINAYAPSVGDSYVLMTADGGFTGGFDGVTLPPAPLGSDWDMAVDANELRLTLVDLAEVGAVLMSDGIQGGLHENRSGKQ